MDPANDGERRDAAGLLPIGAFARACGLSIKALRRYDAEGVLAPAYVDPDTNYRFYAATQLLDAEAVRLLRSLGTPLAEIRALLPIDDSEALAAVLTEQRDRLDRELVRLTEIRDHLDHLLDTGRPMAISLDIGLVEIDAWVGLSRRTSFTFASYDATQERVARQFAAECTSLGLTPSGREWIVYHNLFARFGAYEVDFFQPVVPPADAGLAAALAALPGGPALHVIHRGDYEDIRLVYRKLWQLILEHGIGAASQPRERCLVGPLDTEDPTDYVTDILWPVEPSAAVTAIWPQGPEPFATGASRRPG